MTSNVLMNSYFELLTFHMNIRGRTIIKDMTISGCPYNGIKLSTFITGVEISHVVISNVKGTGIEMRNGNNVTVKGCLIENVGGAGIRMGGGSKNNVIEGNIIQYFGDRGIIVGSDNTEVQYMDVDFATKTEYGSWHDAINCTVINNVIAHGEGAGLSFYSARDVYAVHNTIIDVGIGSQGAILLNLSPKILSAFLEVLPPNKNITFANNIVTLSPMLSNIPMVECRIMQSEISTVITPNLVPSGGNCTASTSASSSSSTSTNRRLTSTVYDTYASNSAGTQGRNADGSCPQFPDSNEWHKDISSYPTYSKSDSIKIMINSGGNLHPDFGGGWNSGKNYIPYGIPFSVVNTANGDQPFVPITIASTGYPDESDGPFFYPFPQNASVEGAYLNCPDSICGGDRHVLVVDNSTCTLYESWRSFPPGVTKDGTWHVDIAVKFNLLNNNLRPLGYTSSDAAGLPVLPGLIQFDEIVNKGEIKHAMRFTGPNSRAAYSFPASHFATSGDTGTESPWMVISSHT